MHNRWYYSNRYERKIAWKNYDNYKTYRRKLKAVTDWCDNNDSFRNNVMDALSVNVNWLNTDKKATQLALRNNLVIISRADIPTALSENNYSLVPKTSLPTPVEQHPLSLAA